MPKIESENNSSSSSSSSGSESDSSTSSEQEKTRGKTRYATSNNGEESSLSTTEKIKPESKKTKIKKGNAKTSSSESSSQSSNENGSSSSPSSSSSNSSGSDTEEGEVKIKQPKPIKSRQDEQRAPDKDDSVKTDADALQSESLKEHVPEVPSLVVMPVSEDIDQQTGQETAANKEIYQQEISVEPEVDISKIDCQEIQCPPQMQEDNAPKDSNPSEINKLPEDQESEKTDDTATTKDLIKDDEPDSKKMKLEIINENPSTASHKPSKETESKKYSNRRDRSRSPIKRDRRRSRDRGDRNRRQRSRTRSRDRRHRRSRSRSRSKDRNRDKSNDRRRKDDNASTTATAEQSDTKSNPNEKITERQRRTVDLLTSRTGGAYIPPAKLRMMQAEITDKASAAYQRIAWEALKKSIHGYINKVNVDNIGIITRELLKENIVRGRGLLCRSIIQAQNASPTFTHVYAALVAIINSKFPNIGELLLKRLVIQFKRAFRRNDKAVCLSASRFVAHLVNQRVAHEILALEILTLLVETPTDDSVEVAIAFLKECGMKLTEVSSKGIGAIFEMLKNILHEGKLDKRVQYMIEVVFQVRKDGFKDHQAVIESLELVEEDDQFTHLLMLDEATNTEDNLNAFKFDDMYATNEDKYKGLSKEILGSDASDSNDEDGSESGSDDDSDSEANEEEKAKTEIIDNTETNLIALRRTIYLTINSSLDYEECAHKLMKMQLKPGQEIELCHMFLDCCAEQRTYEKFYGLLAQRFCSINKTYIEPFEEIFKDTYQTTHRLDTNRLRNVSKFFAHLLFTDAIGWDVLDCIKLNEDDTTSSSRIFIKILFQELAEYMGLFKLNEKLKDAVLMETLAGLFPKDNPRNTRFSINFFSSIGLGGLTDDLRQFLKNAPKNVPAINSEFLQDNIKVTSSSSSSSDSSSSSSSSSSSESESSESSSSDDEKSKKNKKNKKKVSKKKASKKVKKTKSKPERKKRKSKKKHQTSESSESSEDSNSSDDDKRSKKKKKYASGRVDKKNKNTRTEKSPPRQEIEDREHKKRHAPEERISNNGRSMNGRDCDNDRPNGRTDRRDRDNRGEPSPHRERRRRDERNRDRDREQDRYRGREPDRHPEREHKRERDRDRDYNSRRNSGEYRTSGKSRNGSKERG